MASTGPATEIAQESARESLIAISQSVPEKTLNSDQTAVSSTYTNPANSNYNGGKEEYRSKLISISYTQSPDTQPPPRSLENISSCYTGSIKRCESLVVEAIRSSCGAKRLIVDAAVVFIYHGHNAHFSLSIMAKIDALRRLGQNARREEKNRSFHKQCRVVLLIEVFMSLQVCTPDRVYISFHYYDFPHMLLAQHTTMLRRLCCELIAMIEEAATVNDKFPVSTSVTTFHDLHMRGIKLAVLCPAVCVEQLGGPYTLEVRSFIRLRH